MIDILLISGYVFNFLYILKGKKITYPPKLFTYIYVSFIFIPYIYVFSIKSESAFYYVYEEYKLKTLMLFFSFHFLFVSVYLIISKIKISKLHISITKIIYPLSLFFLLLSIFAKAYLIKNGMYLIEDKSIENIKPPAIISYLNNIALLIYPLLAIYYLKNNRPGLYEKIYYVSYTALLIIFALTQGRRLGAVYPIIINIILLIEYNKIDIRKVLYTILITIFIFISVTAIRLTQALEYKDNGSAEEINSIAVAINVREDVWDIIFDSLMSRIGNTVIITNHLIRNIDEKRIEADYDIFLLTISSLVPRIVYPDKPEISTGNLIGHELNLISKSNHTTKINPSWVGESYYSYNILGVIIYAIIFESFSVCSNSNGCKI